MNQRDIVSRATKHAYRAAKGTIGWREAKRRAIAWCVGMSVTREPLVLARKPAPVAFTNEVSA